MKRVCLLCCGLLLGARCAGAVGADLSVHGCPFFAGATNESGPLDCASGNLVEVYVTFMPADTAADLVGIDVVLDATIDGDMTTNASFWDFETANHGGFYVSRSRPAAICNQYVATWSPFGSGESWSATVIDPGHLRVTGEAHRPFGIAYATNSKLFGLTLVIDTSTSLESGDGSTTGCTTPVTLTLQSVQPRLASGHPAQVLTTPSVFGNVVTFNGPADPVPARQRTWGQLKSLYR